MNIIKKLLFVLLLTFILNACVSDSNKLNAQSGNFSTGNLQSNNAELARDNLLTKPIPLLYGPKRTIAVGKFDAIGAFTAKYGNWNIGGGVAAMLTNALKESDRFIVLERANLDSVLSEQELTAQGLTKGSSGAKVGNLIGANLLIAGAVTEFGTDNKGNGFSLGVGLGGFGGLLNHAVGGAISRQSVSGKVVIDVRLINTTTTEVIETHKISEEIDASGWDASVGYDFFSLGTNGFIKTPLGQAVRNAITRAVILIVEESKKIPWTAQVVEYSDQLIYINAGKNSQLNIGDKFYVERIIKTFTDPLTNVVIGMRKKQIGYVLLNKIENSLSYGSYVPLEPVTPRRGDLITSFQKNTF